MSAFVVFFLLFFSLLLLSSFFPPSPLFSLTLCKLSVSQRHRQPVAEAALRSFAQRVLPLSLSDILLSHHAVDVVRHSASRKNRDDDDDRRESVRKRAHA